MIQKDLSTILSKNTGLCKKFVLSKLFELLGAGIGGGVGGGPGDLQIEASCIGIAINDLPCEIQALDALGFHSAGIDLLHGNATSCNDSLLYGTGSLTV